MELINSTNLTKHIITQIIANTVIFNSIYQTSEYKSIIIRGNICFVLFWSIKLLDSSPWCSFIIRLCFPFTSLFLTFLYDIYYIINRICYFCISNLIHNCLVLVFHFCMIIYTESLYSFNHSRHPILFFFIDSPVSI